MTRLAVSSSFLLMLALLGCSSSSSTSPTTVVTPPATGMPSTALQTFQALQSSGEIPVLDTTAALTGTDANSNGVRDDLDKYIASLPDTVAQQKALVQMAQALQSTLTVDTTNATAMGAVSTALNRGDSCIWKSYASGQSAKAMTMEEFTMNTMARLAAYEKYNAARNGAVIQPPTGSTCN
jgi:hypothetical protein